MLSPSVYFVYIVMLHCDQNLLKNLTMICQYWRHNFVAGSVVYGFERFSVYTSSCLDQIGGNLTGAQYLNEIHVVQPLVTPELRHIVGGGPIRMKTLDLIEQGW